MAKLESLDELIGKQAAEFAEQVRRAAALADNEEEIKMEVEKQLAFIQKEAGVELDKKYEFTLASGRADAVYTRVIIEYKNPKSPADRVGPKPDSPGTKKVVAQIKRRFQGMHDEHGHPLDNLFGVGLDGQYFVFVRFRENKWDVQDPVEVNKYSAERFLWPLFNLGQKGKPFSPEYLAADFGANENSIAIPGVHALYEAIAATDHPRAQIFFKQWKILFGEVCGYDVDNPSDKINKLAESYGIALKGLKPAELLFALHSYYALFMKLLAAESVAFFHRGLLKSQVEKLLNAGTSQKLKREMEELELGSIFRHLNITNFLEGDLFAWYTSVWSEPIEKLVRAMVTKLDEYNPGTLSENPATSRDLLKKLYQQLFPKSVRHDLGEYYTPDWLAEHVLNELGYEGDPDKRLLDPACGSGTFLVMAINRIRKWYEDNREKCPYDEGELCQKILANVVGFDLNPLAVMAARTNYLSAIRPLVSHADKVEIPVYLCDSIATPSDYGDLFFGGVGKTRELKTAAANFMIPTEIANKREDLGRYAEQLEICVRDGYSPTEFVTRCREEGLEVQTESIHVELYEELVKLDKANKNGVWARIIKNAFAPIFVQKVDYVAGNPPWVRWGYLPQQYRTDVKPLWRKYGLLTQKGLESLMGTAELDLAILFTYACVDQYLRDKGRLGFLITQEVVRSKSAGEGFRKFVLAPDETSLRVESFHDLVSVKPFEAANKTAFIHILKGAANKYPVRYVEWTPKPRQRATPDDSLEDVFRKTTRTVKQARPLSDVTSPWQVVTPQVVGALAKLAGASQFQGRCGVSIDPYAVFLCKILSVLPDGKLLVANDPSLGKTEVPQIAPKKVEADRIFPIVRGRDIKRWHAVPVLAGIILNSSTRKADMPSESAIKRLLPLTYTYLFALKEYALHRAKFWQFFSSKHYSHKPLSKEQISALGAYARSAGLSEDGRFMYEVADGPFFSLFNVGEYSFSPFKVCWPMGASRMRAAVVGAYSFSIEGKGMAAKCVIPATGTTSYVSFKEEDEAFYLCGLLNSSIVDSYVRSFSSAGRGFGAPSIVSKINLPAFDKTSKVCRRVVEIARRCHAASESALPALEKQLDLTCAGIWGIDSRELASIADPA